jgi:hypothetical protein
MTGLNLDVLAELEKAATAGPWAWEAADASMIGLGTEGDVFGEGAVLGCSICEACQKHARRCIGPSEINAAFIPALRNAAPALIARARRADELEAENAWRPIETAPKDGTVIWATNGDDQFECWWETAREWPQSTEGFNNWSKGHLTAAGCDAGFDQAYPTHWRKRPNDPLKSAQN